MKLRKHSQPLENMWNLAKVPDIEDFDAGGFEIEMATGLVPNIWWLNWRMYFIEEEGITIGYNLLGPLKHWRKVGLLEIMPVNENGEFHGAAFSLKITCFKAKFVWLIREIAQNNYIGKFWMGDIFIGFFYMRQTQTWIEPMCITETEYIFGVDLGVPDVKSATIMIMRKTTLDGKPYFQASEGYNYYEPEAVKEMILKYNAENPPANLTLREDGVWLVDGKIPGETEAPIETGETEACSQCGSNNIMFFDFEYRDFWACNHCGANGPIKYDEAVDE